MSEPSKIDSKIIFAAIDFIRVMSTHYGSDAGIKIWEKVCESIPDENVKGQVFMHMLGAGTSTDIRITGVIKSPPELVSQIKTLRIATGMTLRNAKDAVVDNIGYPIVVKTSSPEEYDRFCKDLIRAGFLLG